MDLAPGDVYLASLCGVMHSVEHDDEDPPQDLMATRAGEVKVVAVVRGESFRNTRGAIAKQPPNPMSTFRAALPALNAWLSAGGSGGSDGLRQPTLQEVQTAELPP